MSPPIGSLRDLLPGPVAAAVATLAAPLLLVVLAIIIVREHARRRGMPPGPRGIPFIGNKHQVPVVKPWRTFAEWNRRYGAWSFDAGGHMAAGSRLPPPVPRRSC